MAIATRQLAHAGLSSSSLRLTMFLFTLLLPVLLGLAIGVWGGEKAGAWGARGVGTTYLGVVGWAWLQTGSFPVGFQLEGFQAPWFVTAVNMGIFLMTAYFMQALGRSGGRLGGRMVGSHNPGHHPLATVESLSRNSAPTDRSVAGMERSESA
jgi:hypothetical protein